MCALKVTQVVLQFVSGEAAASKQKRAGKRMIVGLMDIESKIQYLEH
jgi:hypothetical protein